MRCPVCKRSVHNMAVRCPSCGKRFKPGRGLDPVISVKKNTHMSPRKAIRTYAVIYSKSEMAYQFGISRNSLYALIDRFNLHDVKFNTRRAA